MAPLQIPHGESRPNLGWLKWNCNTSRGSYGSPYSSHCPGGPPNSNGERSLWSLYRKLKASNVSRACTRGQIWRLDGSESMDFSGSCAVWAMLHLHGQDGIFLGNYPLAGPRVGRPCLVSSGVVRSLQCWRKRICTTRSSFRERDTLFFSSRGDLLRRLCMTDMVQLTCFPTSPAVRLIGTLQLLALVRLIPRSLANIAPNL